MARSGNSKIVVPAQWLRWERTSDDGAAAAAGLPSRGHFCSHLTIFIEFRLRGQDLPPVFERPFAQRGNWN
jgi:hypothetical protein